MCREFILLSFSTNISYRSSMIRYDFWFWCFEVEFRERIDDEVDEQIIDAIFAILDTRFDVKTERREDFDAIERETISTQNNCFRDVAKSWDDCFDVADEVKENELKEDVSINIDSFDDEDVAVDVNIVIIAVDVDEDANAVDTASSFDVDFASFAFDVEKNVNVAISLDVITASLIDFFWWCFSTCL